MLKIAWLFVDTYISVIFAVSDLTVISALKTSSWPTICNAIEHSEVKNVPFRCKWLLQCVITRASRCEKKLTRLLYVFGVVNTTDDDCEQQLPSVALCL